MMSTPSVQKATLVNQEKHKPKTTPYLETATIDENQNESMNGKLTQGGEKSCENYYICLNDSGHIQSKIPLSKKESRKIENYLQKRKMKISKAK